MTTLTFVVPDDISPMRVDAAAFLLGCEIEVYVNESAREYRRRSDVALESINGNPARDLIHWPNVLAEMGEIRERLRQLENAP